MVIINHYVIVFMTILMVDGELRWDT